MKKLNFKTRKNQKGITLIALVITIVVLLILAAVSIATLTGENGILTRAQEAKEVTQLSEIKEKLQVEIIGSYGTDGHIDIEQLNENLKNLGIENSKIEKLPANIEIEGKKFVITENGSINDLIIITEAQSDNMLAREENFAVEDDYGNIVTIPAGFKLTKDTTKVTEGIIIEDNEGNQYVWVPVGTIYTSNDKSAKINIELGRYVFNEDGSINEELSVFNPEDQLRQISTSNTYYIEGKKEEVTNNTHAIDIDSFIKSVEINKGYYIARYEASQNSLTNKANSQNDVVWHLSQDEASIACRNIYNNNNFTSDLVNSYAWDTAILFIQKCSNDKTYSRKKSLNTQLINTGSTGDVVCNIYDMASNNWEWTTETCNLEETPCVTEGGDWYHKDFYTNNRNYRNSEKDSAGSFRPILYLI